MADKIALPDDPVPPPSGTIPWWLTTALGVLIPIAYVVAQQLDEPWRGLLLGVAGAIAAALGISHTGVVQWRPPR